MNVLISIKHFVQHSTMLNRLADFLTMLHVNDQSYLSAQSPIRSHWLFKLAEAEVVEVTEVREAKRKGSWKDDGIRKLIDCYEQRPCLWDTFNKKYHNKDRKLIALSEIEEELGSTKGRKM